MQEDEHRLTWHEAVGAAVSSAAYAVRETARDSPSWLARLILVNVLLALAPAAQVIAVAWLVRSAGGALASVALPLVVLTVFVGVGQVASSAANMAQQRVRFRMSARYQNRLLLAVAALPPQRLADAETSGTIQACRSSLPSLGDLAGTAIACIQALVTAVSLCIAVWTLSPLAGVLTVAALIPMLIAFAWQARMQDEAFVRYAKVERRSRYSEEQLVLQRSGVELTTLGSGAVVAGITHRQRLAANLIMDRMLAGISRANLLGGSATAILLGGALLGVVAHGSGGAGVAAGIVAVLSGMNATRGAGFAYGDLMTDAPKLTTFRRFVGGVHEVSRTPAPRTVSSISVRELGVTYPGAERSAIEGVSLVAEQGTIIALVGVNGAGKTTTINAMMGLVDASHGCVLIGDRAAEAMPPSERLAHFGLLTQEFGRYEFTVRDSVRIGRPDGVATDEEIWRVLDDAHAGHFVRQLPDGLDTQLGSQFGGVGLSGGQWQRLALARTYLSDAPIWILDEPTSAVDAEAEREIFADLQQRRSERITIVVSHRAWTLKDMGRIYVFDQGHVVEVGRYDELLSSNGRFAEIFADQVT